MMVQLWLDTTETFCLRYGRAATIRLKEFDLFGKLCISWRDVGKDVMSRLNYDDDGCFDESISWSRRLRWHKSMHMGTPRHCTDEKTSSKCPTTISMCAVQCAYVPKCRMVMKHLGEAPEAHNCLPGSRDPAFDLILSCFECYERAYLTKKK